MPVKNNFFISRVTQLNDYKIIKIHQNLIT